MTATTWWGSLYGAGACGVVYPYAVYPAILWVKSRLSPRPVRYGEGRLPTVSVVIAAYNEREAVARRVAEFTSAIERAGLTGEVVVVSDGSTDGTAEAAGAADGGSVPLTVVALTENVGKAVAVSAGVDAAGYEIVVLADARQTWADDALVRLLENFADPDVGAVSGELFVEAKPGVMAGVRLYWRYEKALRRMESLVGSTVGVTGAICAVRRSQFRPIPAGTVLDDVYWPLCVALRGSRVVFDGRAHAFDRLPEAVGAEVRRKVRTLAGVYQLGARLPGVFSPRKNPVWFAWVSHKFLRLGVPWAYLLTAVSALEAGSPFYQGLFAAQALLTLVGLAGLSQRVASRSRLASAAASFLVLNTAAWLAFWVWASGRTSRSWGKTRYRPVDLPALEEATR